MIKPDQVSTNLSLDIHARHKLTRGHKLQMFYTSVAVLSTLLSNSCSTSERLQ